MLSHCCPQVLLWIVSIVAAIQPLASLGQGQEEISKLLRSAEGAGSPKEAEELISKLKSKPQDVKLAFVRQAVSTSKGMAQLIAAVLLSSIDDLAVTRELLDKYSMSEKRELVEVAWICAKPDHLSKEMADRGWKSEDFVIRSAMALKCSDLEQLRELCLDGSPIVRSFAIRRLASIALNAGDFNKIVSECLTTSLVDQSVLVRSNGLIAARGMRLMPKAIAAGLMLDERQLLPLEDVMCPEQECASHRKQLGFSEETYPVVAYLHRLHLNSTIPNAWPAKYTPLVLSPRVPRTIGGEVANLCVNLDPREYIGTIEAVSHSQEDRDPLLRDQLMDVFKRVHHEP